MNITVKWIIPVIAWFRLKRQAFYLYPQVTTPELRTPRANPPA